MVCEQRIIAQGRTTRLERKRESAEEKIEVEGEAGTTGRPERDRPNRIAQAVQQGIWLWYDDDFCIVLKDRKQNGGLAQLEERVLCKHEVIGSSPIFSTITAGSSAG